jgi:hypothetical protein
MSENRETAAIRGGASGVCPDCQTPRADMSVPCPACGAPAVIAPPVPTGRPHSATQEMRKQVLDTLMQVRGADLEPYIGLRYLSKLFRVMAIIIGLLMLAEIVTGLVSQGSSAVPTLLGEASKLLVLAGLMWGIGDLAILLIDIGHDVRATRILMGRQAAHHLQEHQERTGGERKERGPR